MIRARAAYWAGRSAAALGDRAAAGTWYQRAARHHVAYYGQLAGEELGAAYRPPPPPPVADAGLRADFESKELVRVARMLIEADASRDLLPFLIRLAELASGPAEIGLVGELAAASGRPDLVVQVGRFAAYYGQVNEAAAFPIPELERLIRPPAGEPDAALLLGIARQESVFNSWGASDQGAQGVLQLMPHTALLMARSLGLDYNRGLLTGDPDYNIRLGSHYLKTLLERYDDETALAVAAYNAGPTPGRRMAAAARRSAPGRSPRLVDWVELIPFDETRNYVQRVLEGRGMYRRRLAESRVAMVPFRPVNGPLDPLPAPALKPRDQACESVTAALLAGAPRPLLKPLDDDVILVPAGFGAAAAAAQAGRGSGARRPRQRQPPGRLPTSAGPAVVTPPGPGTRMTGHPGLRVRRLWHAVRRPFGGRPAARPRLGAQADALSQLWRTKQLEYTWLRSLMGRHADFWQVTGEALDYALARTGIDPALREPLMQAYLALDAYPEVPEVLRRLRAGGLRTAILSNGEPGMLQAGAESAGIDGLLDAILSVEDGRHLQARPQGLPARGRPPRRARRARSPSSRPTPGTSTAPPASACARCGSTAWARRPSACPAAPSTSCATSPACRRCSASERTGPQGSPAGRVLLRPAAWTSSCRASPTCRPPPAPAGGRPPHAAARIRGAERAGRRPRPAQGRAAAAHRLVQVPRRLQRDQPDRGAGGGRLLVRQPRPGRRRRGAAAGQARDHRDAGRRARDQDREHPRRRAPRSASTTATAGVARGDRRRDRRAQRRGAGQALRRSADHRRPGHRRARDRRAGARARRRPRCRADPLRRRRPDRRLRPRARASSAPGIEVYAVEPAGFDDTAPLARRGRARRATPPDGALDLRRAAGADARASSPSSSTGACSRAASRSPTRTSLRAMGFAFRASQARRRAGRRGRARRAARGPLRRPRPHRRGGAVRRQRRSGAVRRGAAPRTAAERSRRRGQHADRRRRPGDAPSVRARSRARRPDRGLSAGAQAPQPVRLNLDLGVAEGGRAAASELADVVDYEALVERVRRLVGSRHVKLVEKLAERVARALPRGSRACARRGCASRSSRRSPMPRRSASRSSAIRPRDATR